MTQTPNSGPTLAGLARELDIPMSRAAALATGAGMPLLNTWYGGEVIDPATADAVRERVYRERGIPGGYDGRCNVSGDHAPHLGTDGTEYKTWYRCDGRAEIDGLPAPRDAERARCVTCGIGIRYQDAPGGGWWIHDTHPADGHDAEPRTVAYPESAPEPYTGGMATCMTREPHAPHTGSVVLELAGTEYATKYRCEGVTGPAPQPLTETPLLTDLASLVLRQDMALVDAGRGMDDVRPGDGDLTAWALERAGHLFDHHVLNDYGLVSDEDHFPRCVAYRHLDRTLKDMIPNG